MRALSLPSEGGRGPRRLRSGLAQGDPKRGFLACILSFCSFCRTDRASRKGPLAKKETILKEYNREMRLYHKRGASRTGRQGLSFGRGRGIFVPMPFEREKGALHDLRKNRAHLHRAGRSAEADKAMTYLPASFAAGHACKRSRED
ncbi:hypothetical protein SCFA_100016 [anaerobic digester metagenome]|uniref:Uncharacterized protein n=1 Tax=anaerobic digester metagenome TaxID=1263854 RepID=A0A485LYG4_9ZZZZ